MAESSEEMSTEQLRSVAGGGVFTGEPNASQTPYAIESLSLGDGCWKCATDAITSLIALGSADKCQVSS